MAWSDFVYGQKGKKEKRKNYIKMYLVTVPPLNETRQNGLVLATIPFKTQR